MDRNHEIYTIYRIIEKNLLVLSFILLTIDIIFNEIVRMIKVELYLLINLDLK